MILFTIILGFIGIAFLGIGIIRFQEYLHIKNTPTEKVRSLSMGRTELEGTVHPSSTTIDSILSVPNLTPVYCDWKVKRRKKRKDKRNKWVTVTNENIGDQFILQDETGKVEVNLDELTEATIIEDEHKTSQTYSSGNSIDETIRKKIQQSVDEETFEKITNIGSRVKITQEILPINSDCYVLGKANPKELDETSISTLNEDSAIITETNSGLFIVSDGTEEETIQEKRKDAIIGFTVGFICFVVWLILFAQEYEISLLFVG